MAALGEGDRIVLIDRRLFKDDNTGFSWASSSKPTACW